MGSNMIIALIVGAILVIVGFALWPVLNSATNGLYAYFQDSCDDGNSNRFLRAYYGNEAATALPSNPENNAYYVNADQHGGSGEPIEDGSGSCEVTDTALPPADDYAALLGLTVPDLDAAPAVGDLIAVGGRLFNENGEILRSDAVFIADTDVDPVVLDIGYYDANANQWDEAVSWTPSSDDYQYVHVAPMLRRFAEINNLLLTILPVISIAGFLGISGAKLYSYGKGVESMGSSISTALFTLIGIVVAMVIAAPVLGSAVTANQVVESGQYQINGTFNNIIALLFAMIPVVYVAGLVTLVGMQTRSAFLGNGKLGGNGMGSMK